MSSYMDKKTLDCDMNECNKKCPHYKDCLAEFKLGGRGTNNPSTLSAEISNFEIYDNSNTPDNFKVNICEVPGLLINKAIISQFNSKEEPEVKNIITAALNKFVIPNDNDVKSSIIKYDSMKYHFVFNCVDCNGLNDFVDYATDDNVSFYCRYCGKKHKFDLTKVMDATNNKEDKETKSQKYLNEFIASGNCDGCTTHGCERTLGWAITCKKFLDYIMEKK